MTLPAPDSPVFIPHSVPERFRIRERARRSRTMPLNRLVSLGMERNARVLDLGCGSGVHTIALASWLEQGSAVGLERDFNFVLEAKALVKKSGLHNASIRLGSAESLKFENDSFDHVYSRLLFQHLADPLKSLREIRRVLVPGGKCVVEDIDRGWFMSWPETVALQRVWQRIVVGQQEAGGDPFIGRKLDLLFKTAGFRDVRLDMESVQVDGSSIASFVGDTGESLLEYVPDSRREKDRSSLRKWAALAAEKPAEHNLYMVWFTASGSA